LIERNEGGQMAERELNAEYFGVADAETVTGVSRWTWRRWAYSGKVNSVKLGRRLLIPASEISRLVAENMRPRFVGGKIQRTKADRSGRTMIRESELAKVIEDGVKSRSPRG